MVTGVAVTLREELRTRCDHRVTDAELDAAILAATPDDLRTIVTPDTELRGIDDEHPAWDILDRAWGELQPKIAVIITDRTVLDGSMFDPGSIARFVVEHASGDLRAEVFLVIDGCDKNTTDLIDFARRVGFRIATISMTRNEAYSAYSATIANLLRREYERVTVADPWFETADPRVEIHRRVTR